MSRVIPSELRRFVAGRAEGLCEYCLLHETLPKAYEEVVELIAAGTSPQNVIAFRPSDAARERVWDLVAREKAGELSPEDASELAHYLQLEHIMRLAKARAQRHLRNATA